MQNNGEGTGWVSSRGGPCRGPTPTTAQTASPTPRQGSPTAPRGAPSRRMLQGTSPVGPPNKVSVLRAWLSPVRVDIMPGDADAIGKLMGSSISCALLASSDQAAFLTPPQCPHVSVSLLRKGQSGHMCCCAVGHSLLLVASVATGPAVRDQHSVGLWEQQALVYCGGHGARSPHRGKCLWGAFPGVSVLGLFISASLSVVASPQFCSKYGFCSKLLYFLIFFFYFKHPVQSLLQSCSPNSLLWGCRDVLGGIPPPLGAWYTAMSKQQHAWGVNLLFGVGGNYDSCGLGVPC